MRVLKSTWIFIFLLIASHPFAVGADLEVQASLRRLADDPRFVEVKSHPGLVILLKYASTDNFTGTNLYGTYDKCYLHRSSAEKLEKALNFLKELKPGWKLVVFDALRPRSVQRALWSRVKGTGLQRYVANPEKGSIHNYGLALDVGLMDEKGRLVDMGTPFDSFTRLSEPRCEIEFLKEGKLTQRQEQNRLVLRLVMTKAGFSQLPVEWWHYDAMSLSEIRGRMPIVE